MTFRGFPAEDENSVIAQFENYLFSHPEKSIESYWDEGLAIQYACANRNKVPLHLKKHIQSVTSKKLFEYFRFALNRNYSGMVIRLWENNDIFYMTYLFPSSITCKQIGISWQDICSDFIQLTRLGLTSMVEQIWRESYTIRRWFTGRKVDGAKINSEALIQLFQLTVIQAQAVLAAGIWNEQKQLLTDWYSGNVLIVGDRYNPKKIHCSVDEALLMMKFALSNNFHELGTIIWGLRRAHFLQLYQAHLGPRNNPNFYLDFIFYLHHQPSLEIAKDLRDMHLEFWWGFCGYSDYGSYHDESIVNHFIILLKTKDIELCDGMWEGNTRLQEHILRLGYEQTTLLLSMLAQLNDASMTAKVMPFVPCYEVMEAVAPQSDQSISQKRKAEAALTEAVVASKKRKVSLVEESPSARQGLTSSASSAPGALVQAGLFSHPSQAPSGKPIFGLGLLTNITMVTATDPDSLTLKSETLTWSW
jgi:hypothetical protein